MWGPSFDIQGLSQRHYLQFVNKKRAEFSTVDNEEALSRSFHTCLSRSRSTSRGDHVRVLSGENNEMGAHPIGVYDVGT
jgi:hypothetical protein